MFLPRIQKVSKKINVKTNQWRSLISLMMKLKFKKSASLISRLMKKLKLKKNPSLISRLLSVTQS